MPAPTYSFGEFELDPSRFELRRHDRPQKLERIPMELLILLVERDGQVVSRQEIIARLWGKDVFVDTEHGINTAIRKIRAALREDVEKPRFIQTVSGKGYRFVIEKNGSPKSLEPTPETKPEIKTPGPAGVKNRRWWLPAAAALVLCIIAGAALGLNVGGIRDRLFANHQIGPIHSIAVLPLANLSGDPAEDYFADGMTDELITALAKTHSLRVVSRTSAMQYKGVNRQVRDIARELGVDGILEGSVERSPTRVHMTVQLIYAPSDTHVWAESYDRDTNEAFLLPTELSQTIATQVKAAVSPPSPQRYINPEAHDAYLRGRHAWWGDNYDKSKEYFEKAIQLQPDYAAAWAGYSDSYAASAVQGYTPPQADFAEAGKAAQKALELDDSLAEAHNSMAAIYFFGHWDWGRAEAESRRCIELDPNYAEGYQLRSFILSALNRDQEALQVEKRSLEIDPFSRPYGLARAYIYMRQYDDAINDLRARADVQPRDSGIELGLREAYRYKGMEKEAAQHEEKAYLLWGIPKSAEAIRHAFERGGDKAVLEWELSEHRDEARKKYVSPFDFATDYAHLGRKEETLQALEDAYRERSPWLVFLQKEPAFDFLHSDERYRALVKKIGLPPAY